MSEGQGAIDPLHCTVGIPIRFEETPLRFGESIENNFFINFEGSHGNKIDKRSQFLYNLPFDEHICCT